MEHQTPLTPSPATDELMLRGPLRAYAWRTVRTEGSIRIAARPAEVMAIYCDHRRWPELFPATIRGVQRIVEDDERTVVEVDHRAEGRVPNILRRLSPEAIELTERKPRYDAVFVNRFEPASGGALYTVEATVVLRWPYALLAPALGGLVNRRIRRYVLEPMRERAERTAR